MPDRRCRRASAIFLIGVIFLLVWQGASYPVQGHSSDVSQTAGVTNESEQNREKIQIEIKRGDTLWKIAQDYGTTIQAIVKLNQISNPNLIITGQKLWVAKATLKPVQTEVNPTQTIVYRYEGDCGLALIPEVVRPEAQKSVPNPTTLAQSRDNLKGSVERTATVSRGNTYQVSDDDLHLLARVIYAEARGENFEGQVAVGAVVLNRVEDAHFPKTIRDVIYQPGAFTAVADKQIHLKPNDQAYRAAEAAIAGNDPTGGALYYYNPRIATDRWIKTRPVIKTIGNHTFSI